MTAKLSLTRLIITFIVVGSLMTQTVPGAAAALGTASPIAAASTAPCGSAFGYTKQTQTFAWKDLTSTGTKLDFPTSNDDSIATVNDIGFDFPFYENSYKQVHVSTNGFISFGLQDQNAYANNYPLPSEFQPNNIIAGFWDDLTVGGKYNSGSVYYQSTVDSFGNPIAVFEWYRVTRLSSSAELSFEIILAKNGDITLNYESINGTVDQATVGIEDSDGVDGCQLFNNEPGLVQNQSFEIVYPVRAAGVKVLPLYQGEFLVNGYVDFPVTVVNTGAISDSFQLQPAILDGAKDWQIQILDTQKNPLLNNTTPTIVSIQAYPAYIRVHALQASVIGAYIKGQLTVNSKTDPSKTFTIRFDAAVPTPFAAFYVDSSSAYIQYSMPKSQTTAFLFRGFTGSTFALTKISGPKFLTAWENIQYGNSLIYGNIQKSVMGPTIGPGSPVTSLVNNVNQPQSTSDASPIMAVSPSRRIGMVYKHVVKDQDLKRNTNIYFAGLDSAGNLVAPVQPLTQDSTYTANGVYNRPVVAATVNNGFVVAYESFTMTNGTPVAKDIDVTVLNYAGQITIQPKHITNSLSSLTDYYAPTITQMNNGDVFIAFSALHKGSQVSQVDYTIFHPGTGTFDAIKTLNGANGESPQLKTLKDGQILLAWVEDSALNIDYTVFNPSGGIITSSPQKLASPKGWKVGNISLTGDNDGNGIITWNDDLGYYIYYALIGTNGIPITPAMAFLRGSDPINPSIIGSSIGMGIAPLDMTSSEFIFLPLLRR